MGWSILINLLLGHSRCFILFTEFFSQIWLSNSRVLLWCSKILCLIHGDFLGGSCLRSESKWDMTIVYIFPNVVLPHLTQVFVDGNCGNNNTALSLPKVHLCSMAPWTCYSGRCRRRAIGSAADADDTWEHQDEHRWRSMATSSVAPLVVAALGSPHAVPTRGRWK